MAAPPTRDQRSALAGARLTCGAARCGGQLGATGRPTGGKKRHPTVGSRVVLGAGSTVLGDIAVGDECTVGAAAIVTKDVPTGSTVIGVNKVVSRADVPKEEEANKQVDDYNWYFSI